MRQRADDRGDVDRRRAQEHAASAKLDEEDVVVVAWQRSRKRSFGAAARRRRRTSAWRSSARLVGVSLRVAVVRLKPDTTYVVDVAVVVVRSVRL
jgi:hypothetical protein